MMTSPRSVVIPFGVPDEGRGLGLGLAALVHSFAQIDGEGVALAQLLARASCSEPRANENGYDEHGDNESDADAENLPEAIEHATSLPDQPAAPVEAFIPPRAWKDLTGSGSMPSDVSIVVTGTFEPPIGGRGLIQLLVFDAKNGYTRAKAEAHVDGDNAGQTLLAAFDEVWSQLGGELGTVRDIGDLSWDALESVLRAERCALHDPLRGGPHDRLAAMAHLGRAIFDAPDARFPASRLAALALDTAFCAPLDGKLADAALRALVRATEDAPKNAELLEAVAAFHMRAGNGAEAEKCAHEALLLTPGRPRLYALVSEARRARGDLPGALSAIEDGLLHGATDPLLNTERGIVLAERGNLDEAESAWRMVLDICPMYAPAFTNLASLSMERKDTAAAAGLVDMVLVACSRGGASPEMLRRSIQLLLAAEPEGIARAARVNKLACALVETTPNDPWVHLVLARAASKMGNRMGAIRRLALVEKLAPSSVSASEAQRGKFALEQPQASLEIDAVLRAAYGATAADLDAVAARARSLAIAYPVWHAFFAAGIAERRRERWRDARDAFTSAIRLSAGATPAHMEIVAAHIALGDPASALAHARRACELGGETARSLAVLATALLAVGDHEEARQAIDRALDLDTTNEANRALAERIRAGRRRTSTLMRLREVFARWRRS